MQRLKFEELPVLPFVDDDGQPLTVYVELPGRNVQARLWEIRIGRITVLFIG